MKLQHPALTDLLQQAYSAEKAAAFAYQGHAASLKSREEKNAVHQIENDEWSHRREVLSIMTKYEIPVSKYYELRFHIIGKLISWSCYILGRFMPFYFAGRLESGNVCEYFRMKQYFNAMGITAHDAILHEMGIKEKEHEVYFAEMIKTSALLPFFERLFSWSYKQSFNNVDLNKKHAVEDSADYCIRD
jgi:rubrerythrin